VVNVGSPMMHRVLPLYPFWRENRGNKKEDLVEIWIYGGVVVCVWE